MIEFDDGRRAIAQRVEAASSPPVRAAVSWGDDELRRCASCLMALSSSDRAITACVQLPDAALPRCASICASLSAAVDRRRVRVVAMGDTSFGSCCVDEVNALHIAADAVLHVGHACGT